MELCNRAHEQSKASAASALPGSEGDEDIHIHHGSLDTMALIPDIIMVAWMG